MITHYVKTPSLMRLAIVVTVAALVIVAVIGLFMEMHAKGERAGTTCLFSLSDTQGDCTMSLANHLTAWQLTFTAIPATYSILIMAAFILVLSLVKLSWHRDNVTPFATIAYQNRQRECKILHYFIIAFSTGILHPKIYESATHS